MRPLMCALIYLVYSSPAWGQDFFRPNQHVVWLDDKIVVNLSISPDGNVLLFEEQVRGSAELTRTYMTTAHGEWRPHLVWESDVVEHVQALDGGTLLHPRGENVVYHIDINLAQTTLLAAGFRTNLGDITSVEHIMVDDMDPTKIYFVGTTGGIRGIYRLIDSRTARLVTEAASIGYREHSRRPYVSGSRLLSLGKFGDLIHVVQTDIESGVSEKLFRAIQKTGDRYYWHTPLTPWSGGNLLSITTVDDLFPPQPGRYNYRTDLLRVNRGTFLPADVLEDSGLSKIMSAPRDGHAFQMTQSANWGTTIATLHNNNESHAILEDGSTLVSKGNRLFGDVLTRVELFSSSKVGMVGIVQKKNPNNTYSFGFYFVRTAPDPPPPVEEDKADPPIFSTETITNAATLIPGPIAPHTWTSIFGDHLISKKYAWRLYVDNVEVSLERINLETSTQINFLTPDVLGPEAEIAIVHFDADGFEDVRTEVTVPVSQYSPGLFQYDGFPIVTNNQTFALVLENSRLPQAGIFNLWGTGFTEETPIDIWVNGGRAEILGIGKPTDQQGNVILGLTQVNVRLPDHITGIAPGEAHINGTIFPLRFYVEEAK